MKEVFNFCGEIGYDLKQQNNFRQPLFNSVYKGTERVSFVGSKIWEIMPKNMKKLESFKKKKKTRKLNNCSCVKHMYKMLDF